MFQFGIHSIPAALAGNDLDGIGSTISMGKCHKDLFTLVEKTPRMENEVFAGLKKSESALKSGIIR